MANYNWTRNVHFFPWVGQHYRSALTNNRRLLLLGNSHYFTEGTLPVKGDRRGFTKAEVSCAVAKGSDGYTAHYFYRRLQAFLGSTIPQPSYARTSFSEVDPFENVAFYNFLQVEYEEARESRSREHYRLSEAGFFEVLTKLKPTHVLVCGKETWNLMNEKYPVMTEIGPPDWTQSGSDAYSVECPCKCKLASIIHPSYSEWYKRENESKNVLKALIRN